MATSVDDLVQEIEETEVDRNEVFLQSQVLRQETFLSWLENQELEISEEELEQIAEKIGGKLEDVTLLKEEFAKLKAEFDDHLENHPEGGGGGGGTCNLSSTFSGGSFSDNTPIEIPYTFYSSNLGTSMLYVEIKSSNGELESMTLPILESGDGVCNLGILAKNDYTVTLYALDSRGVESNHLSFKISIGSLEVSSTFNDNINYQVSDSINIPLIVSSVRDREIIAHVTINGEEYTQVVTEGYNMFSFTTAMKTVGVHKVEIYLDNGVETSNTLNYTITIINAHTILVTSKQNEIVVDYGYVITLNYKISSLTSMNVTANYYIDDELVGTYTVPTGDNTWRITDRLDAGSHTLKVVINSSMGVGELSVPLTVNESTFEPITHVDAGLVAYFNANDKTNVDEDNNVWTSRVADDNGVYATGTLYNYNFATNGWEDGWLHSTVGSYVEIDMQPLVNNALSGFSFDILFRSRNMGIDENVVASCRDVSGAQKGFIVSSDEARIKGDTNNIYNKYIDNEETRVTFVIDRTSTYVDSDGAIQENPMVQIYLNGVMSSASLLTDSGSGSNRVYESFATNSKIYLNGLTDGVNAGESFIKTVRVYNRPLGHEEVLRNVMADIEDIALQREEYERNYTLLEQLIPTMYFYDSEIGTHANMTKDNKQYIRIRYDSPDEEKFGKSFDLPVCRTAWQGTSSLQYPIKNYKFNCYDYTYDETTGEPVSTTNADTFTKVKINPFNSGYAENAFCLKCDYMESSHSRNTGTAKFVNDVLFKGADNPAKQQDSLVRETINGFPIVLYINGQRIGIYNFNHDKSCSKSLGLEAIEDTFRFEIAANSETTTGAFNKTWGDNPTKEEIYEEILSDFEIAFDEDRFEENSGEFDITSYCEALGIEHDGTVMGGYKDRALLALAEFIQFVSDSTDEEFKTNLHNYCDVQHAIRYWINVQMFGMIDNYAKNTMINCFDGHVFYFTFYDMDSSLGLDNTGYQINPSDIEMMEKDSTGTYYFNCATSKMWSKLFNCFYDEICEEYITLRNGTFTLETMKKYLIEDQIDQIPTILYNQDQFSKYISQGRQYLHMLHGRNEEHILRWIDERIKFLDSLFMGIQSIYTSKSITIRSNNPSSTSTTYTATLNIEPYNTQYITVKWRNGEYETHKVKKGQTQTYSFAMVNATDNEVLVYSADNLKKIGTLENMNPSSLDIGNATGLIELNCRYAPALLKADVSKNVKLQKIDLCGCSMLGDEAGGSGANVLDIRNCINLTYVDVRTTKISNVLNSPTGCAIETLYLGDVEVVRLVGYNRLKNFACGTNLKTLIAKDVSLNLTDYFDGSSVIEDFELDNCAMDSTFSMVSESKPSLKRLVLKNIKGLTTITLQQNVYCSDAQPSASDVSFSLNYVEISDMPDLETITLGRLEYGSYTRYLFGFDNNNAMIYLHDLPKLTTVKTGGISGLNKLIIPQTLSNFTIATTSYNSSSSAYQYGDGYLYCNNYFTDQDTNFFTWDTIISDVKYKENPNLKGIVSFSDMPNCNVTFDSTDNLNALKGFKHYDGIKKSLKCSSSSSDFYLPTGVTYSNTTFILTNTGSYPTSSYKRYLDGIDFRTCTIDTTNYNPANPQYLGIRNCTFDSVNNYSNICSRIGIGDLTSYVDNRSGNIMENNPITLNKADMSSIFRGWTFNGDVVVTNSVTDAEYLMNGCTVNGNITFDCNSAKLDHALWSATINGSIIINEEFKGTMIEFMENTICEEAPLLPVGASDLTNVFLNAKFTKTPANWQQFYEVNDYNDLFVKGTQYTGCSSVTQIAPVVNRVVGEYSDGTIDDIPYHWGGNKKPDIATSSFEIVLTEDVVPYTFYLTTSTTFVKIYGDTTVWGDGTSDTENEHTYTTAGTYVIETSKLPDNASFPMVTRVLYLQNNYNYYYTTSGGYYQSMFAYASNVSYINLGTPTTPVKYLFGRSSSSSGNTLAVTDLTIDMDCSYITDCSKFLYSGGYSGTSTTTETLTLNLKNVTNITTMQYMVYYCKFKTININIVDDTTTENLTTTNYLCSRNYTLTAFNGPTNWNLSKVTDASYMFYECDVLTQIDVSGWTFSSDTDIDMKYMFGNCYDLVSLDVSKWNTGGATDMTGMFYNCQCLTYLDLSNWDVSNVTLMGSMFYYCYELQNIDVSNWVMTNVTNISYMFYGCKLTALDVSKWKTNNVVNMSRMFYNCQYITSLDVTNWDVSNVTDMYAMFYECRLLETIGDVLNWDTSKVTTMGYMFYGCYHLTTLNVSKWNTSNVTIMKNMFTSCRAQSLDVSNWVVSGVTDMERIFYDCKSLTSLDVSKWDVSGVTSMYAMFEQCSKLTSLDLSEWDVSNVTTFNRMFYGCNKLTTIGDVSNWNTSKVTTMGVMFYECFQLASLDLSNWNTSNNKVMSNMFESCSALTTIGDVSNWDTTNVTDMYSTFKSCSSLTTLNLSNWNVGNVTNMEKTFYGCKKLTTIGDVSNWNTSKVTCMRDMFDSCVLLESINVSKWNINSASDMRYVFYNCQALTSLDISGWSFSGILNTYNVTGLLASTTNLTTVYYNSENTSEVLQHLMTTYADKTWVDTSVQALTEQVATLQEESDLMMLALTDMYEQQAVSTVSEDEGVSVASTFGLTPTTTTVTYIDALMPTIYARLIKKGYKTIDDVPATLQQKVQSLL